MRRADDGSLTAGAATRGNIVPVTGVGPFPFRTFGVLLHPTSLPGPEPIGTLGAEATAWIDWLATTGAGLWQVLPLNPTGDQPSPYFANSAFAGNPWLVDLRELEAAGLVDELHLRDLEGGRPVDFDAVRAWKGPHLRSAARRFLADASHPWRPGYDRFVAEAEWLAEACHFMARKALDPATPWWEWDAPLRRREPAALASSTAELADSIAEEQALQYFFDRQWRALRARAAAAGMLLLGDLPIYVAPDSADVWANQEQFELDEYGRQTTQAGVPPDYFSVTGQLWRNPLYRWDLMEADGFSWWISRLRRTLEHTDVVRIDHFRALSAYWSVPAGADTAASGEWVPGPGQAFLDAVAEAFPTLPLVAEDLGDIDADVEALRDDNGLVGMRVLQFGFGVEPMTVHHPSRIVPHTIVYTGTHDNATLAGWWRSLGRGARRRVRAATAMPARVRVRRAVWWLIDVAFHSPAVAAVVPAQDLLVLGDEARMNTPSTTAGNWQWRLAPGCLTSELATELRTLAQESQRANPG